MICKNCGTNVPDSRERCHYCDSPMNPVAIAPEKEHRSGKMLCKSCGNKIEAEDVFCKHCGAPKQPESEPAPEAASHFLKICPHCGAEMESGDLYCAVCGKALTTEKAKKPKKFLPWLMIGLTLVAAIAIIAITDYVNNTPEAVAEDFVKAMYDCDAGEIFDLYPPERMEQLMEENDRKESQYENRIKSHLETTYDYLIGSYGENWSVTIDGAIQVDLSEGEWQNYWRSYQRHDIDMEAAEKIRVNVVFDGACGQRKDPHWVVVVKIDGRWYVDPNQYSLLF